jgi:carbonic anhydrase
MEQYNAKLAPWPEQAYVGRLKDKDRKRKMKVQSKLAAMVGALLCVTEMNLPFSSLAAEWHYDGAKGADHWGKLAPEFATYAVGAEQSPIDLTAPIKADLEPVRVDWNPTATWTLANNGHTIQANTANGGKITISGTDYQLRQFHFHTPSEHAIHGKRMPMEVYFVHVAANGTLAVLGAMMAPGGPNEVFQDIIEKAPRSLGKVNFGVADILALLPDDDGFFRYQGSLTTPPCSEIVVWTVFKSPIVVSAEHIAAFAAIFPNNARPLQPARRRFVLSR